MRAEDFLDSTPQAGGISAEDFLGPAKQKKQNQGIAADLVTDVKRGVEQLPGAVTGLVDIPIAAVTGSPLVSGLADKAGEITGFQPSKWAKQAEAEYSPSRQAGRAEVDKAWENGTASDIAGAYLKNPMNIVGSVAESLPSMLAGGLAGRAALGIGAKAVSAGAGGVGPALPGIIARTVGTGLAPAVGAGIGEGGIMAGQAMANSLDAGVDPRTAAGYAGATGLVGGALGALGGKVAQRFGVVDPETLIASGIGRQGSNATGLAAAKEVGKRMAGGAISEGLFEELPQSVFEQGFQNLAQDKPLTEGMARAGVEGALAGSFMGGAFNMLPGSRYAQAKLQERPPEDEQQPIAGLLPAPRYPVGDRNFTDYDYLQANQAAIDAADKNAADLYAMRDAFEASRQNITLTTDPVPLQQRFDELISLGASGDTRSVRGLYAGMDDKARAQYEKDVIAALSEPIGIRHDANQREVPFTMGEYLDAQVSAEDALRAREEHMAQSGNREAANRLAQLADEEAQQHIGIAQDLARSATQGGALSKAALTGIQTGATQMPAHPERAAIQQQMLADEAAQAELAPIELFMRGRNERQLQNLSAPGHSQATRQAATAEIERRMTEPVQNIATNQVTNVQAGTGQQAAVQPDPQFDVSKRTDAQLAYLASNGRPGWKEAAAAELQRRGKVSPVSPVSPGVQAAPVTAIAPDRAANISRLQKQLKDSTPMSRRESNVIGKLISAVTDDASKSIEAGSPPAYSADNGTFIVIHPSAQQDGMIQVTRYAENGVFGDSQYNNVEDAIRDNGVWMKRRMTEAEATDALGTSAKAEAEYEKRKSAEATKAANREKTAEPQKTDSALQNRDRGRAASVNQMQSIARNPDYMRLGPSRTPDSGAPMVFAVGNDLSGIPAENFGASDVAVMADGQRVPFRYAVIDASRVQPSNFADGMANPAFASNERGTIKALNNGRTAGIRAAHSAGNVDAYVGEMIEDGAHGVSSEAIRNTPNPMLVRVYAEDANTDNMAAKSQGQGLGMSASERAAQDAEVMTGDVLDKFAPLDIAAAGNRDFVRAFVGKLPENELADMMDATGNLSQDGRRRIEAALLTAAYGKSDLVQELFESTDTDIKAIGNALKVVSGQWAIMRQAAKDGVIDPAVDMTGNLMEAVNIIRRSRAEGSSVAELAGQGDLMGGNYLNELSELFLRIFYRGAMYDRARSGEKVITGLQDVVTSAMNTKADAGLFGDSFKPTPKQIVQSARNKIDDKDQPASQSALFGANGQATAAGQGNRGEGAAQPGEVGQRSVSTGSGEEVGKQAEPVAQQAPAPVERKVTTEDARGQQDVVAQAKYAGPADVSSRAGQMELSNRAGTIAALKGMNEQLRKIAPDEAWADRNIEDAQNLDALRDQISQALVDANRGKPDVNSLRKELEELSGQELKDVFSKLNLAGKLMAYEERISALLMEDAAEVRAAISAVTGNPSESTAQPVKAAEAKAVEPWKITQAEYVAYQESIWYPHDNTTKGFPAAYWSRAHKDRVEEAIAEGKPVPANVLADYPDLKPAAVNTESKSAVDAEKEAETDDGIRYSKVSDAPAGEELVAIHNLTSENVLHAAAIGGIPVPSIGITKLSSPFTDFGEITLIADKGMIDPENSVPVFDRDAYTARFPEFNYKKVTAKKADAFYERMNVARELSDDGQSFISQLWDAVKNARVQSPKKVADLFRTYLAPRMLYAKEVLGKEIKAPMIPIKASVFFGHEKSWRDFVKNNAELKRTDEDAYNAAAAKAIKIAANEFIDRASADNEIRSQIRSAYMAEVDRYAKDGVNWNYLDRAIKSAQDFGKKRVDAVALSNRVAKIVPQDDPGYLKWVSNEISDLFVAPTITLRGKEVEASLDNIVEAMTIGKTNGAEKTMTFGVGKTSALLGKRFKSIKEIQDHRNQVVSSSRESDMKKDSEKLLEEYRLKAVEHFTHTDWKGHIDTFAGFDAAMVALAKAGKGALTDGNIASAMRSVGFKNVPSDVINLARQGIVSIREAATDYFEAKPQRAVKLNEFNGAVVPNGTNQEVIDALKASGITDIRTYKRGDEEGRKKSIALLAKKIHAQNKNTLFSKKAEFDSSKVTQTTTKDGDTVFETGVPVTFNYLHNKESATKLFGKPSKDSPYNRGYEPSGKYVIATNGEKIAKENPGRFEAGTLTFNYPLVLDSENWKVELSNAFGGLAGKRLSVAIIEAGFDGVVTANKYGPSEILDLTSFDYKKAKYSESDSQQQPEPFPRAQAESSIKSILGDKLGKVLIDSGIVSFTNNGDEYEGATYKDGSIVLNLDALNDGNFAGVFAHEGFHSAIRDLVGEQTYAQLMKRLDNMRALGNGGQWFKDAVAAVPADTKAEHVTEEIAAYAVKGYVNGAKQPNVITRWVESLLSALRTAIIRRLPSGKLKEWAVNNIQPQDLANLAIAGLKAKAGKVAATSYAPAGYAGARTSKTQERTVRSVVPGASEPMRYGEAGGKVSIKDFNAFVNAFKARQPVDNYGYQRKINELIEEIETDWSNGNSDEYSREFGPDKIYADLHKENGAEYFDGDGDLTDSGARRYSELERKLSTQIAKDETGEPERQTILLNKAGDMAKVVHAYLEKLGLDPSVISGSGKSDSKYFSVEINGEQKTVRVSDHQIPVEYQDRNGVSDYEISLYDVGDEMRRDGRMESAGISEYEAASRAANVINEMLQAQGREAMAYSRGEGVQSSYELPNEQRINRTIDRAELKALRRAAARMERPEAGITFRIDEDGTAIATGPKGVRVPERYIRFANDNGLAFEARRLPVESGTKAPAMPDTYRVDGALYFGEMASNARPIDRTGKTRFSKINRADTPAFKKWFGDSKVVDADGKPLVVYHGTNADFSVFKTTRSGEFGPAIYLTDNPREAGEYGEAVKGISFAPPSANIMPVYARIENPYTKGVDAFWKEFGRSDSDAAGVERAKAAGYDGIIAKRADRYYDNVAHEFVDLGNTLTHYIAFSNTQVKSAIGNNGDFGTNPDIRYSRAQIVGDSGRQYDPQQRQFFKNVGRDIEKKNLVERTTEYLKNDFWKKMAVGIVDQFRGLRDLGDNGQAYMLARLSKGTAGAFDALLHHGKLSIRDGVYDADTSGGFIDRLGAPLHGELDDFLWYVAANRAEGLSKVDRENLFTPADIAAGKSLAKGQTNFDYTIQTGPQKGTTTRNRTLIYSDANRVFNEFQKNTLDMAEQSGLIDGASRKLWESEFYVPFYRVSEEDGEFIGAKMGNALVRQQAFKKLKGGTDKLNSDLLSNTLLNFSHLIEASAKNRAAKASLAAAEKVGAAQRVAGTMAEYAASDGKLLPPGTKKTVWYMGEVTRKIPKGQTYIEGGVEKVSDGTGEVAYTGKIEYAVSDPFVMTAITSLEYAGMRNGVMDVMTKFKHFLTIGVTASPAFKVRNLIRDSIQSIGASELGYNPIKNITEGYKQTRRDSQEYVSALASGGLIRFGTMLEGSESARVRQLVKSGVKDSTILNSENKWRAFYDQYLEPAVSAYNELGNRSEEINRAALYNQLVKQGKSHAEAALLARDLMDFSMQGSFNTIRFLTQVVPFMNARLQGMYKLGRAAKDNPRKLAVVTGAVAMASIALMLAYGDDDDWKRREDWDRDNFWWFKLGGIEFRIPKPFEIGAIATLAERGLELMIDDEMTGERFRRVVNSLAMNNLSMNPIPQAFKPILDLYANKDSFTGRPIESMGMERLDPTERFNSNTTMVARGLSSASLGALSPVQFDHLTRSYFGWLGSFVIGGADMAMRAMSDEPTKPALDYFRFGTQGILKEAGTGGSRYVTQVYEQAKELEQAHATWRQMLKDGRIEEAKDYAADNRDKLIRYRQVEAVKRTESNLNERIRRIERSDMDSSEKKNAIALVNKQKEAVAMRIAPGIQYGP